MKVVAISLVSLILAFILGNSYDSDFYGLVIYFLLFYFLFDFIYSLGRSLRILDLPILLSIFQLLIMPAIIYYQFNDDPYVRALQYNMSQPRDVYFGFMVPSVIALIIGLKVPLGLDTLRLYAAESYRETVVQIKKSLIGKEKVGIILIVIGFLFGALSRVLPAGLGYFNFLFSKLTFVGILYVYFSDSHNKTKYLAGGILLALAQSLISGLFGDLIYLTALSTLIILLGKNINVGKSFVFCILGFLFVVVIQTIKTEYRVRTWGDPSVSKVDAFVSVATDKVVNFENNFTVQGMFPIIVRFNQGMLVDKTMNYVPSVTPYQDGRTIWLSLLAAFIPRYVWPDKPEAGGHANMILFTGLEIEGYSMNVGPYGEAWGNFGKNGGIVYLFFYGLFFNFVFYTLIKKIQKHPTLLLWVPYLFLNSIQVETDTLMTVNTIIKGALFIWGFFFVFKRATGLSL